MIAACLAFLFFCYGTILVACNLILKSPAGGSKNRVWQSVFNPGRNYHPQMQAVGNSYYDNVASSLSLAAMCYQGNG